MADAPSLASLLPRLFISMAVVIVLMYVAARVLKNRQSGRGFGSGVARKVAATQPASPQIIGRQGVGKNASVTVVQVGKRTLVLGVTDRQVSLLTELDGTASSTEARVDLDEVIGGTNRTAPPASLASVSSDPAWKELLEQVRERTVRRA